MTSKRLTTEENMTHPLASLLTLFIMVIGLALIIGGPGAVRFLFAPLLAGVQKAVRWVFIAVIVVLLILSAVSRPRSVPEHVRTSAATQPHSDN